MKAKTWRGVAFAASLFILLNINTQARDPEEFLHNDTLEDIAEEQRLGDMELLAQLVHAEAGNQSLYGKRLVADVVLNRVRSPLFPDTVEEVIFQEGQFSVVNNGEFIKAAYNMEESDYKAVETEWENLTNTQVLYFNNSKHVGGNGKPFKVGAHYFNSQK